MLHESVEPASDAILPAKQDRSRDKRDRLLKAGAETFASKGYDETRIADIAKAAGMSVGTFYQRFKDKRTFFDALNVDFVARSLHDTEAFFDAVEPGWDARILLEKFTLLSRSFIARDVGFIRAMLTLAPHDSEITNPIVELDTLAASLLEAELAARKLINPDKLRKDQVFFACGAMKKTLVVMANNDAESFRIDDKATINELVEMIAAYLGIKL